MQSGGQCETGRAHGRNKEKSSLTGLPLPVKGTGFSVPSTGQSPVDRQPGAYVHFEVIVPVTLCRKDHNRSQKNKRKNITALRVDSGVETVKKERSKRNCFLLELTYNDLLMNGMWRARATEELEVPKFLT